MISQVLWRIEMQDLGEALEQQETGAMMRVRHTRFVLTPFSQADDASVPVAGSPVVVDSKVYSMLCTPDGLYRFNEDSRVLGKAILAKSWERRQR